MIRESDRIKNKLLALDIRLVELKMEMRRTELLVLQLEAERENSRLANLLGEETHDSKGLEPRLVETRKRLDAQRELVRTASDSQKATQVLYLLTRRREQAQATREESSA